MIGRWLVLSLCLLSLGCGSRNGDNETTPDSDEAEVQRRPDGGRCQFEGDDHEVSEYDTSGDEHPDVRKVFLRVGSPPAIRLVLICREIDLNADGSKDVFRFYSAEGRPLREESDRDFDGRIDQVVYFEEGRIIRSAMDESGDGHTDHIRFYENGVVVRAERDLGGRSTQPIGYAGSHGDNWQPDRWEYYQRGQTLRVGMDLDGDGRVDRWDRNDELSRILQEEQRQREEAAEREAAETQSGGEE